MLTLNMQTRHCFNEICTNLHKFLAQKSKSQFQNSRLDFFFFFDILKSNVITEGSHVCQKILKTDRIRYILTILEGIKCCRPI